MLVLEQKKGDSSSTVPFLALQFIGIVIISFLAFLGEVSYYYITFMIVLPFPSVLVAIVILKILQVFEGNLGDKTSEEEEVALEEFITKADLIIEQVAGLQNKVNNLSDHFRAMKQPSALWWLDNTTQKQFHYYEKYVENLENVLSNAKGYQQSVKSYQADLESIVTNASSHQVEFTTAENELERALKVIDSLIEGATDWLEQMEQEKPKIHKKYLWDSYQQKALAHSQQKEQVKNLRKEYHQANATLQEFTQVLTKEYTLATPQSGQIDQLEAYLRLQQNSVTLSKLKTLQSEVLQLKRNVQQANQQLQTQDKKVNELWMAYQTINGGKVYEISLWRLYDADAEEAFWEQYEQVVSQMKGLRTATIQKAG